MNRCAWFQTMGDKVKEEGRVSYQNGLMLNLTVNLIQTYEESSSLWLSARV
jgi:hypothetical protein